MGVIALLRPSTSALFATNRSALAFIPSALRSTARPPSSLTSAIGGGHFAVTVGWSRITRQTVSSALRRIRSALKRQSCDLVRLSVTHFEFLLIQRVKSSIQVFQLYSNLYEREALVDVMRRMAHSLALRGRQTLLAAAVFKSVAPTDSGSQCQSSDESCQSDAELGAETACTDQSGSRIPVSNRLGYDEEFGEFDRLRLRTIHCSQCGRRQVIDKKVAGVLYCSCENGTTPTASKDCQDGWAPFLEAPNIVVWRRQHEDPDQSHLYAYRVYGSFSDVTADAFCEVQLNTELRDSWDDSVQEISTLISPHSSNPSNRTDIIYWVVRFPRMFSNRDYVFERQCARDPTSGQVTIVSRSVCHDQCPPRAGLVRVSDYWSVLVVRPHSSPDQPGMDFGLTYFDNPGTQLPTFVTNYVAASGLPDFLDRVANAARRIQHELTVGSLSVPLHFIQLSDADERGRLRAAVEGATERTAKPVADRTSAETAETNTEVRNESAPVGSNSQCHLTRTRIPAVG